MSKRKADEQGELSRDISTATNATISAADVESILLSSPSNAQGRFTAIKPTKQYDHNKFSHDPL